MTTVAPTPLPHIPSPNKSTNVQTDSTNGSIHQIYEGQKFYWRQRLNVDLNFIFHRSDKLLEIISYDSDKSIELNRIYLNSDAVYDCIYPDLNLKVQDMKKELSKDRFKKVPPDSELIIKVGDNLISQFILNRLIAVTENNVNLMRLSALSADSFDISKIIVEKTEIDNQPDLSSANATAAAASAPSASVPAAATATAAAGNSKTAAASAVMTPASATPTPTTVVAATDSKQTVKINRRRKTTSGEFDRALGDLRQNSMELNEACDRAAKLTELSSRSVNSFKDALKLRAIKYDKAKPMDRFRWAVRRVILNNTVERVRRQLAQREKYKTPLRINATFPLPDGSIINPANAAAQLQRIPLLTKIHETYSNGPSPFGSPSITPRQKNPRTPPTTTKTNSISDPNNPMPAVNQKQKSAGKILMASASMPLEPISNPPPISPTNNQNSVHLPSLKDGKSPSSNGLTKDKKKTTKK